MMKTRIALLLLCGVAASAPALIPAAHAQKNDAYQNSWKGIATLKTLSKREKTRELSAAYPNFYGSRPVAQVAGLVLKHAAMDGFESFEKDSRGGAKKLGLSPGMSYSYSFAPTLVLDRPRFISATAMVYSFTGGAHGMYDTRTYNFGYPETQGRPRQLELADFFSDGAGAYTRVNALLLSQLRRTRHRDPEATWVVDGTVRTLDPAMLENFVAEADGLRWYFAPYSVGPYAAGEFEVKLSARELGPKFRAELAQ